MYCHTCGAQLTQSMSYCNRCGAHLFTLKDDGSAETADTLVWVIVGTTITLLGMSLGALVLMNNGSIERGLGAVFVIISFVALLLVEGVLLWRLLGLKKTVQHGPELAEPKDLSTENQAPDTARDLQQLPEQPPRITEQTTRTFEPSQREGD